MSAFLGITLLGQTRLGEGQAPLVGIEGSGFRAGLQVTVDDLPVTELAIVDDEHVRCRFPPLSARIATVVVTNADGQSVSAPFPYV